MFFAVRVKRAERKQSGYGSKGTTCNVTTSEAEKSPKCQVSKLCVVIAAKFSSSSHALTHTVPFVLFLGKCVCITDIVLTLFTMSDITRLRNEQVCRAACLLTSPHV